MNRPTKILCLTGKTLTCLIMIFMAMSLLLCSSMAVAATKFIKIKQGDLPKGFVITGQDPYRSSAVLYLVGKPWGYRQTKKPHKHRWIYLKVEAKKNPGSVEIHAHPGGSESTQKAGAAKMAQGAQGGG